MYICLTFVGRETNAIQQPHRHSAASRSCARDCIADVSSHTHSGRKHRRAVLDGLHFFELYITIYYSRKMTVLIGLPSAAAARAGVASLAALKAAKGAYVRLDPVSSSCLYRLYIPRFRVWKNDVVQFSCRRAPAMLQHAQEAAKRYTRSSG